MSEDTTTVETPAEASATSEGAFNEGRVGALHQAHADYIQEHFGVEVDPVHIFLIYSSRNKFRSTDAYREGVVASREQARVEAAKQSEEDKAKRDAERAEKKTAAEAEKAQKAQERADKKAEREADAAKRKAEKEAAAAAKAAEAPTDEDGEQKATKRRGGKAADATDAPPAPF